jgi:ubiquinone/menaquinone biosynthesis C-methylase UbiE
MSGPRPGGFSDVDSQTDTSFFIHILEAQDREPGTVRARDAGHRLLDARPGMRVLDVGCGIGTAAIDLACLVEPGGSLVGIDISETMLDIARGKASGVGAPVEFLQRDASSTGFDDNSFDAARSERVFQHIADPEAPLAEMIRVVRPGGRIVVVDTDWDTFAIDLADAELVKKLRASTVQGFVSATVGRRLFGMFQRAGLQDVQVEPVPVTMTKATIGDTGLRPGDVLVQRAVESGGLTAAEGDAITQQMKEADEQGTLFVGFTMYAVGGTVA